MARKAVMQSPILPGTSLGETKTERTDPQEIITLGRNVCIRWKV